MRPVVRAFLEAAVAGLDPAGPVLEVGALRVAGQERLADLRALLPGRAYVGLDQRAGPGVDVVGDAGALPFADASQGTVLCLETLEHVFEVRKALDEIRRVLRPGGLLLASTPFHFHLHAHPDDYWRLTPSCWRRLLTGYALRAVGTLGPVSRPHTVLALAAKGPAPAGARERLVRATQEVQRRLADLARAQAPGALARLRALALSKGERQARAQAYTARFTLEDS